ncbi:hypothetical protein PV377_03120 [Streptomyces ipomoeae]|uniref:hypothetical protein n=1 Tax=Streptomyces ipomoeae TaxID=103232 RepID=UPI0029AC05F1|nr:hypothetical protein [Streptomyces ipomoeae]MDX2838004.1 hypothetical protein [Streptomyces ipomoeae]
MNEPMAAESLCEHGWKYNKPAHATESVRICTFCHTIDGEDLMRTLNEYAEKQRANLKQKPTTLLYAHSDGEVYSYVDGPGGIPHSARERALLRALLVHTLAQLDQYEITGGMLAVPHD